MEYEVFKEKFEKYLKEIQIVLKEKQLKQFYDYMNILIEWNKKINLTTIVEPEEIILKHFIDSIIICNEIKEGSSLIDVGTGAGFPGIPIKILRDDINVVLLDSLNKRIKFLNEVINCLKLEKISTVHGRAEDVAKNKLYREQFDIAISRAVANLSTLSEYLIPFVKIGGMDISMKSSEIADELNKAKVAINLFGGKIVESKEYILPNSDIKRSLILIQKEKSTHARYPRRPGLPAKEPIIL